MRKSRKTSSQDSMPDLHDSNRRTVIWHASSTVLVDAGVRQIVEYNDGQLIHVNGSADISSPDRPMRKKLSDIASLACFRRASIKQAQMFSAQSSPGLLTPSAATPAAAPGAEMLSSRPLTTQPTPPIREAAIRRPDAMGVLAISVDGDQQPGPPEEDARDAPVDARMSSSSIEPASQQELGEGDADPPSDEEAAARQAANEVMQLLRNRQASLRV